MFNFITLKCWFYISKIYTTMDPAIQKELLSLATDVVEAVNNVSVEIKNLKLEIRNLNAIYKSNAETKCKWWCSDADWQSVKSDWKTSSKAKKGKWSKKWSDTKKPASEWEDSISATVKSGDVKIDSDEWSDK